METLNRTTERLKDFTIVAMSTVKSASWQKAGLLPDQHSITFVIDARSRLPTRGPRESVCAIIGKSHVYAPMDPPVPVAAPAETHDGPDGLRRLRQPRSELDA